MAETLSGDGSPLHPMRPSTEGHRQTWQTGSQGNHQKCFPWNQHSGEKLTVASAVVDNMHLLHVLPVCADQTQRCQSAISVYGCL